jgi:hypothetical protein
LNGLDVYVPLALGAFLVVWVWVTLVVRASTKGTPLVKMGYDQYLYMAFKGLNVVLALSALAQAEGVLLALLVLSRVVIVVAWLVALLAILDACGVNKRFNNGVRLMAAAREKDFSSEYGIVYGVLIVLGLLDLSLLRLLPWVEGRHTDMLRGYPNVFMVRLVLYSSLVASVIQLCASAVHIESSNDSELQILFLAVSCAYTVSSFLDVALFVQYATGDQLKAAVLTEEELRAVREGRIVDHALDGSKQSVYMISVGGDGAGGVDTDKSPRSCHWCSCCIRGRQSDLKKSHVVVSKNFVASMEHPDDTVKVLHNQLKGMGAQPLQFIPLEDIRREVNDIVAHMSDTPSTPRREGRLEYLFECLKYNEDYKREQEEVCDVIIVIVTLSISISSIIH